MRFHKIPRLKGDNSLQFSFVTKLAHTINISYPIYDEEVARAFSFTKPSSGTFETRLEKLLTFYAMLRLAYSDILAECLLSETIQAFRAKFSEQTETMHDVKVLDFFFWSAGKLIRTNQLTAAPNRVFDLARRKRHAA